MDGTAEAGRVIFPSIKKGASRAYHSENCTRVHIAKPSRVWARKIQDEYARTFPKTRQP